MEKLSEKPAIELIESVGRMDDEGQDGLHKLNGTSNFTGAVQLADGDVTYLIPTPSADPRDPLNLPKWRKWVLVVVIAIFSTLGLSFVSGLGGILGLYIPKYAAQGYGYADITHLMTFPTLFMGIGNIFGMPLALAIGRRPVYLGAIILIIFSCVLCATAKTYEWHLAARMVLGLAAGQSEALVPLMVQECHFLHERGRCLMWYSAFQCTFSGILTLMTSYIGNAIGADGWYFLGAGLSSVLFVISLVLIPETKYLRPLSAYQGETTRISHWVKAADGEQGETTYEILRRQTTNDRREMDLAKYKPRTIGSDLRIFVYPPDWTESWRCVKGMVQVMFFPNIFWAFLINGVTLGINIAMGTTYGAILEAVPYSWDPSVVSLAMTGQIVVAIVAIPTLGNASDRIVKFFARRHRGVHEPEYRLVPLVFPIVVGIISSVIYGQAAQHPYTYQWFAIVFGVSAYYFAFLGANQTCITYALDSYPTRSGPVLVAICALRGIMSFGTSYAVAPFIDVAGYSGTFGFYGALTAFMGLLGIVVFFTGKWIRVWTSKFVTGTRRDGNASYA